MLDDVDLTWMRQVQNCFLIRSPAEVIVSMSEFRNLVPGREVDLEETARRVGIPQLRRLFDLACEIHGGPPPVIDANDVLRDPSRVLRAFCQAVGMPFDPDKPIQWAAGRHKDDGAWADHWYEKVYNTTCLGPFRKKELKIPKELEPVVEVCMPTYDYIASFKMTGRQA